MNGFFTYILANPKGMLYVGVTNNIRRRVAEHKAEIDKRSYTSRYGCKRLVYVEWHPDPGTAILREKQIKTWGRKKKSWLIATKNPGWRDLSNGWRLPDVSAYG